MPLQYISGKVVLIRFGRPGEIISFPPILRQRFSLYRNESKTLKESPNVIVHGESKYRLLSARAPLLYKGANKLSGTATGLETRKSAEFC
jgi:hypothetical protein